MRKSLLVICLCLFAALAYTQSRRDSLYLRLDEAQRMGNADSIKIIHARLGWYFLGLRNYDSSRYHYWKVLSLPLSSFSDLNASSMNSLGMIYSSIGLPDSSLYYYQRAMDLYDSIGDEIHASLIASNLSIVYKNKGLYEKALGIALSSLVPFEGKGPSQTLASTYNTIGSIYYHLTDYDNALTYYHKGLTVREALHYSKGIGQSYNNLGETYERMEHYDSALAYYLRALEVKQQIGDYSGVTLNNVGHVFLALGDLQRSTSYLLEALGIAREFQDPQGEAAILNNLGEASLGLGRFDQARSYLHQASLVAQQIHGLEYTRRNLELFSLYYSKVGDFVNAFRSSERLLAVKDSLVNEEMAESLSRLQVAYETDKKEQQIAILNQEKLTSDAQLKVNRILIYSLIAGAGLIIIILVLVYRQYLMSQRNKARVEILLEELHHRVKNNLQILSSILTLQAEHLSDSEALQALRNSEARINAMALIHRQLYNRGIHREISLPEYVRELTSYLIRSHGFREEEFNLTLDVDASLRMDIDRAIPLGLILNELVTNSFKYAFAGQSHPALTISCKWDAHGGIILRIRDNGVGLPAGKSDDPGTFGIKMVKSLLKELKGELSLISDNGTTVELRIPPTSWRI